MIGPNVNVGGDDRVTRDFTSPASVSIGDWVYSSGNDTVDKADASDSAKYFAIGLVIEKPETTTATVQMTGVAEGVLSGLTAGLPLFLSETAGQETQTVVTTNGSAHQFLGMALNTTDALINIESPIERDTG